MVVDPCRAVCAIALGPRAPDPAFAPTGLTDRMPGDRQHRARPLRRELAALLSALDARGIATVAVAACGSGGSPSTRAFRTSGALAVAPFVQHDVCQWFDPSPPPSVSLSPTLAGPSSS